MDRLWKNYSLSIVLAILFLVSWAIQTWTGWQHFAAEQQAHGELAQVFGEGGYIWRWGEATFENWQSEFLQLLTFVVLTSFLIHKGSHESKDSDEEMQAALRRIEQRLERLDAAPDGDGHRAEGRRAIGELDRRGGQEQPGTIQ
jgi:hypothetical protein